jgi:hypothetical protein
MSSIDLVVQVEAKAQKSLTRLRLNSNEQLSIGRGWNNSVILQDKYVDAEHLSIGIDEEGNVLVNDLDTANGTRLNGDRISGGAKRYSLGQTIYIGDTKLRLLDANTAVAEAPIMSLWHELKERVSSNIALLLITLGCVLVQVLHELFLVDSPTKASEIVLTIFYLLLVLAVWSLSLGLVSKLVRGQSNLRIHWIFACFILTATTIISVLIALLRFNLQSYTAGELVTTTVFSLFGIFCLFGVFSYTTFLSARAKYTSAVIVVLVVLVGVFFDHMFKEPHQLWSASTQHETTTMPPALLLRMPVSPQQYAEATAKLFEFKDLK